MVMVSLREELFGAGDSLDVDLDIAQQWSETTKCWVNKQYQIAKVHQHIRGSKQIELPLNEEADEDAEL
jgi:hypothetical protein